MKFDRELFKEAYKAGYKKALMNERKIDSFDKTYQKRGRGPFIIDIRRAAQRFIKEGEFHTNEIRQSLKELNDDRPLEQYLKSVDRFHGLLTYLYANYDPEEIPKKSELEEVYKTYRNASTNLENLFNIINNTDYRDREAKRNVLQSISDAMEDLETDYKNDFALGFGDWRPSDLDPKFVSSVRKQIGKKQQKRLHNSARSDINMSRPSWLKKRYFYRIKHRLTFFTPLLVAFQVARRKFCKSLKKKHLR